MRGYRGPESAFRTMGYSPEQARHITGSLISQRAAETGETIPERYMEAFKIGDPASSFAGRPAPRGGEVTAAPPEVATPEAPRIKAVEGRFGGLGGLGGVELPEPPGGWKGTAGDMLQAAGLAMMESPRDNVLRDATARFMNYRAHRKDREAEAARRGVMAGALQEVGGFSAEEAARYATNPDAAELVLSTRQEREKKAESQSARDRQIAYFERIDPELGEMARSGVPLEDVRDIAYETWKANRAGTKPPTGPLVTLQGPDGVAVTRRRDSPSVDGLLEQGYSVVTTPSVAVDVNTGGESTIRTELNKDTGALWGEYLKQGTKAATLQADLADLRALSRVAPQGPISGRLAESFPGFSSAGEAFQAKVSALAPTMRVEGSGSTSDIEYEGMLRSLAQLRNTPEGNKVILDMMNAKADIDRQRANVISQYQRNLIGEDEVHAALNDLQNRSIASPALRQIMNSQTQGQAPSLGVGETTQMGGVSIRRTQ